MWSDTAEKIVVFMYFKGKAVEHINTCLPSVFMSLHLFDTERWMLDIGFEEKNFLGKFFPNRCGKFLVVIFKWVCTENPHFLRSARSSLALLNDLTQSFAIASSASVSAIFQL